MNTKEKPPNKFLPSFKTLTMLAAAVLVGIGLGVALNFSVNASPENVASSQFIDISAPDPQICVQYGASAIAVDAHLYLTLNPFNVYLSQPKMQPGCVLRSNDWAILEQKKLVTNQQEQECKNRLNTFAFTGHLENSPRIECIYQNDAAGNLFLKQAGISTAASNGRF